MIEQIQELLSQNKLPSDNVSIFIKNKKLTIISEGNSIFEQDLYYSKIAKWITEEQKNLIKDLWNSKKDLAKNKMLAIDTLKVWCDEMGNYHDETVLFDICNYISKLV